MGPISRIWVWYVGYASFGKIEIGRAEEQKGEKLLDWRTNVWWNRKQGTMQKKKEGSGSTVWREERDSDLWHVAGEKESESKWEDGGGRGEGFLN